MITAITIFILFFAVQLICGLAALLFSNMDKLGSNVPLTQLTIQPITTGITLLVGELLLAFGLWWWFFKIEKPVRQRSLSNPELGSIFKFKPLKRELSQQSISLAKGIMAVVATLLIAAGLSGIEEHYDIADSGTTEMFMSMKDNPLCLIMLCLVGPIAEELTFRVGILRSLFRQKMAGWLAALITASLFALVHGNLAQGTAALIVGFAFGLMYLRTGDLRLCLPAHVLNNTLAVVMMFIPSTPELGLSLGIILTIVGIVLLTLSLASKNSLRFSRILS